MSELLKEKKKIVYKKTKNFVRISSRFMSWNRFFVDKVLKTCLSPALDDNYLSKNNASTQVLYLNKKILSDFFQNENCCFPPDETNLKPLVFRLGLRSVRWFSISPDDRLLDRLEDRTTLADLPTRLKPRFPWTWLWSLDYLPGSPCNLSKRTILLLSPFKERTFPPSKLISLIVSLTSSSGNSWRSTILCNVFSETFIPVYLGRSFSAFL